METSRGRQRQRGRARKVFKRQAEADKRNADSQSRGKKCREILTEVGKIQSRGMQRQSELEEEGNGR